MYQKIDPILLAEDDPNDVELILAAFEQAHIKNQVHVVSDGEQALDFLYQRGKFRDRTHGDPLVLLLDLKMPKIDGLGVVRALRADERFRCLPVIMLTSSQEEEDIVQSYRLGVNAYVTKPVSFQEFVETVKIMGLFWVLVNEVPHQHLTADDEEPPHD